jgi:hypothetical protein
MKGFISAGDKVSDTMRLPKHWFKTWWQKEKEPNNQKRDHKVIGWNII